MPNYCAQVAIAAATGNTEDVAVNNFAIACDSSITTSIVDTWETEIIAFYEDMKTISAMLGRSQTGHTIKVYAADGSKPNYPIDEREWSFAGAVGSQELPQEVALCVSYANTTASAVPRARRRGRIYISGWASNRNDTGRPTSTLTTNMPLSYKNLCEGMNALSGVTAGVWSRVNSTVYPIDTIWCDNEWDTMRSRGGKSTSRNTVVVT